MIELSRFVRLMPKGLVSVQDQSEESFQVAFKRFDVETGAELEPEISCLTWQEVVEAIEKNEAELVILRQLLEYKK